ncbi:c-type cytochrome biogenesis protein CcsB [Desertifilum sp. FACHB-1129]|uniref:Cytochrome c biogenesis protein CcsA n=1 Tax=Desertifilum tharense IPPAS B-1220 TaxID=1781255 RepID=A0A1E5QKD2_9CYAN|nr:MULTISPECIES: c-type cytochrome biogenesis protein CcsB [Desertifilum]MDA0211832.1 c-type cytochrome biogenesis protein CcsB [Cyanobacteria bacterium FC1]MBD2312061.1 c-type cytochrome biogenesis protein CcsB [Desertifilum sp. FACHB-1129]MBD2322514.1 c-type cytochrome biogenesis protein CcsB [Desertifilum sp. FACHB-866]MBD2332677.1 c-type cytochrome biogenesis protein CcsB [Desertifilum sp. FACHB-868]OEJ75041.1 c-type cytochrome biogenesis protein CcsB [Desertifilum tharense IPPAS B-1220]
MDLVTLQNALDNVSFAVLFLTMLLYWSSVAFPKIPFLGNLGTAGMAIASLCIATLLGARWLEAGYFPLSNLYESLLFIAWGITVVHLLAENMSGSRLVGAFTAPVAMGITAFAALTLPAPMQSAEPLVPALKSNWLMMHVSVMLLSYACLMVGALLAIAFLLVTRGQAIELHGSSVGTGSFRDRALRNSPSLAVAENNPASVASLSENNGNLSTALLQKPQATTVAGTLTPQRLNVAETLDNISYRIIGLGFPLLTIGIIAGAVWANEAWGSYWSWDPKETWALITWLVFAAYLHARITRGWQGRRPAILAATGFMVVWVCYLGVNLLGKGLHSYGWFF